MHAGFVGEAETSDFEPYALDLADAGFVATPRFETVVARSHAASALASRFGEGPIEGQLQAHLVTVQA